MANSAAETLAELKQASSANNAVYATLKIQYTGSWRDDINQISKMTGVPVNTILQLNPWLTSNNFVANNHDYITIKLTSGSPGVGGGSNAQNQVAGFYSTDAWFHPLGVGTWYCKQEFHSGHTGIDLTTGSAGGIQGKNIFAVKAGTVVQSYLSDTWGYTVLIRHDDTKDASGNCYYTRYAHMETAGPGVGTKVSQGDKVGTVGNTGKSTGYHLHFQIYWTSATRTDYTAFTGDTNFSVNPNSISDFPGIPYVSEKYFTVEMQKNPYISDDDVKVIQGAARNDGSVSQSQFDQTVNGIADKIITGKNVDPNSQTASIIKEYVKAQLDGIKSNASDYASSIVSSGDFAGALNRFCNDVYNQSIWFVQNKVNNLIQAGIDYGKDVAKSQIDSAKSQLKTWIWNTTNTDPNSELATSVGVYLDNYVDMIVNNGWSAVTTAISTGDIAEAAQNFITITARESVDYVCELGAHALGNAITSYIGSHFQSSDASQMAADLVPGICNTLAQAVGAVLKGDISFEQAAKNVVLNVFTTVTAKVVSDYIAPVVTNFVVGGLTDIAIGIAGDQIGGAIGNAIAPGVGYVVGVCISAGVRWVANAIFGS